ncbi:MAG TPA: STAS/SEC14 domain-containing protein [Solirubrobacterales bacterium]|nr:STAS/SEC14 domain-containing protein [Solirubrobacterales bacterium]
MIERIEEMPAGAIGLRASGKLTKDDYVQVLEPALKEGVESGEMRLVFALPDFDGLEAGAMMEDVETGLRTWVRDHSAWKRFAFVTDVEWLVKAMRAFAWLAPGEVRIFAMADLEEAKSWVAG